MDFSEERTMILEMIANGKVSVEDGEELIKALNASVPKRYSSDPEFPGDRESVRRFTVQHALQGLIDRLPP